MYVLKRLIYLISQVGKTPLEMLEDRSIADKMRQLFERVSNWSRRRGLILFFCSASLMNSTQLPSDLFSPNIGSAKRRVLEKQELVRLLVKAL